MKCLFCGKELPLLKRFAGAEFCSDEHRQQYRQEYSELALSRLAQQKSAALGNAASDLAGNKASVPTNPQPSAEQPSAVQAPKALPSSPPMKLAEPKADARKPGPRPLADAKSTAPKSAEQKGSEAKVIATPAASPKPALVTRSSRPPLTPTPVAPASTASEPGRGEAKRLPITAAGVKPTRSVVPLQETRPLRVTETRAAEAKAADSKAPEAKTSEVKIAEAKMAEPARPSRSSAHTPLRLELPVGPASIPGHAGPRPAPERRVIATPQDDKSPWETHKLESAAAPPVEQAASPETAIEEPVRKPAIHKEPEIPDTAEQDVAEQDIAKQEAAEQDSAEQDATPLAGLVRSQPPCADWNAGVHADLQMAYALQPQLPPGEIRPRAASLNAATHLTSTEILSPWAPPPRPRPVRLEIREFARLEPVLEFKPMVDAPRVAKADHAVVLSFAATAVQAEPKLWAEPAHEFGIWVDPAEQAAFLESLTAACGVLKDSAAPSRPPQETLPDGASSEDVETAGRPAAMNGTASSTPHPIGQSREPQPVTRAKTVVSEGLPGGKAKPVQMFTSTLRESMQAAIPYYDALPLRATMVVEPSAGNGQNSGGSEWPTGAGG